MSTISETTLRVRYAETDQMGVVYHSNYIIWLEVGRVELLRQLGFSYQEMEAEGLHLPVVEVKCRYKHPARYDDEVTIRTHLAQMRASLLRFHYEVVRKADGRLLAEGESVHVVVGHDLKRTHLTGKYRDALHAAVEAAQSMGTIRHSDARS
ncbi:MAG: thioesterase family protein [Candidatus Korobacteraceae bacterium]|jgi:acyl-CoA thioester hydrolase